VVLHSVEHLTTRSPGDIRLGQERGICDNGLVYEFVVWKRDLTFRRKLPLVV
jgi:hypothetical protein